MAFPSQRPNYPSIRASCDRCRAKKLACVISTERTESGARKCVRCHRAKACCVFGPRAQNTRRKTAPKAPGDKKPRPLAKAAEPPQPRGEGFPPLTPPPPAAVDGAWVEFPAGPACISPTSWFDGFIVGTAGECCGTGFDIHNFCHDDFLVLDHFLDPGPPLDFSDSAGMAASAPMDSWEYWGGLQLAQPHHQQSWADGDYNHLQLEAKGWTPTC